MLLVAWAFGCPVNAATQVYPDFEEYSKMTGIAIHNWLQHYKIGGIMFLQWNDFLLQQWTPHRQLAQVPMSTEAVAFFVS